MSADREHECTNALPALGGRVGTDVVLANPVLHGEPVDDIPVRRRVWRRRLVSWWQRSPRVPAAFKSRRHAVQAGKDLAVAVLRSPWRVLGCVVRGLVAAGRAWRRWLTVRDFREAAEQTEKLADKFTEIRQLTLFRWKVTGAVLALAAAALLVAYAIDGARSCGLPARPSRPCWLSSAGARTAALAVSRSWPGRARSPGRWTRRSLWRHSATPS
jgi:hypothetical protein